MAQEGTAREARRPPPPTSRRRSTPTPATRLQGVMLTHANLLYQVRGAEPGGGRRVGPRRCFCRRLACMPSIRLRSSASMPSVCSMLAPILLTVGRNPPPPPPPTHTHTTHPPPPTTPTHPPTTPTYPPHKQNVAPLPHRPIAPPPHPPTHPPTPGEQPLPLPGRLPRRAVAVAAAALAHLRAGVRVRGVRGGALHFRVSLRGWVHLQAQHAVQGTFGGWQAAPRS